MLLNILTPYTIYFPNRLFTGKHYSLLYDDNCANCDVTGAKKTCITVLKVVSHFRFTGTLTLAKNSLNLIFEMIFLFLHVLICFRCHLRS